MLKNGFNDLGVKADFLSFSEHNYNYSNDNVHYISRSVVYFDNKMSSSSNMALRIFFGAAHIYANAYIFMGPCQI